MKKQKLIGTTIYLPKSLLNKIDNYKHAYVSRSTLIVSMIDYCLSNKVDLYVTRRKNDKSENE